MKKYRISKEFRFEAAHCLASLPDSHPCNKLHGHSYRIVVIVGGSLDQHSMIVDYRKLGDLMKPLLAVVDHQTLNAVLENKFVVSPTAEAIAEWFFGKLSSDISTLGSYLEAVRVSETNNTWAECYEA